jgi:hypothetical protein
VPDPVAGGLEQAEGLMCGVQRLGGAALQAGHEVAEVVRPRLPDQVAYLAGQVERTVEMEMGGVQRGLLGSDPVVPASALVEERERGAGELAGVAVEPGVGGVGEDCEQDVLLGGEPRQCLVGRGERFG